MSTSIFKNGIIEAKNNIINPNMFLSDLRAINQTAYCAYQINLGTNMTVGQKYTVQLWDVDVSHTGKTANQLSVALYWSGGMNAMIEFKIPSGHADYLVGTFTAHNNGASGETSPFFHVYNSPGNANGTRFMKISKWKLEAGTIGTPFIYNSSEVNSYNGNTHALCEDNAKISSISTNWIRSNEFIEV